MSEEHILHILNNHGVDFMLACETQKLKSGDVEVCVLHILVGDSVENRIELSFALREMGGKLEIDVPEPYEIPNDPDWLLLSPAHCVKIPNANIFVFRSFPGLDEPYAQIKERADLSVAPNGEMLYSMCMKDKIRFANAFSRGDANN